MASHFWPHYLIFLQLFGHIGSGPKNAYFQASFLKNLCTQFKNKFVTPNYIFMLHMPHIFIFISYLTNKPFLEKLDLKYSFTIKVPEKNAFIGSCQCFQEIIMQNPKKILVNVDLSVPLLKQVKVVNLDIFFFKYKTFDLWAQLSTLIMNWCKIFWTD